MAKGTTIAGGDALSRKGTVSEANASEPRG